MALRLNTQCALCSHQENEHTADLIIEQKFHRTIIGQKGERIWEIREKFPEVIISFPDPAAHKSDMVQLRGPKNEVDKCTEYMHKMVADLWGICQKKILLAQDR
ncbi:vigilin-like [Falco naumanni]|uniref:vigilin-like n=1 Tax=Falco naumanni TaxID=148594 RepID=UPI001ADE9866|nr:vigilin-like [Falco naumanni]